MAVPKRYSQRSYPAGVPNSCLNGHFLWSLRTVVSGGAGSPYDGRAVVAAGGEHAGVLRVPRDGVYHVLVSLTLKEAKHKPESYCFLFLKHRSDRVYASEKTQQNLARETYKDASKKR